MAEQEASPIRSVSDTALWVAIYRAQESERTDALFHDPCARRLGGARGPAIVENMPHGRDLARSLVVRVAVMDGVILQCVHHGVRGVLNLAAGLDARRYRLELPPDLLWLHVDRPAMVDYFHSQMAQETPRCRLECNPADLRDTQRRREVFARAARHGPLLVSTEGLLIYLETGDVAARDLHDTAGACWWPSDLACPAALPRWQLGARRAAGQCAVPLRSARRHRLLRTARLARSRMPFHLRRSLAPGAHAAAWPGCGAHWAGCSRAGASPAGACPASC